MRTDGGTSPKWGWLWRAQESVGLSRGCTESVPRPHQSPDSKGLTDWAQRTDFKVEMRNRLGFLKGYGHGGGRRTEMWSPGLRWTRVLYPAESGDDRIPRFSEVLTLSVCVTVSGTHKGIPCSLNRREQSSDFRHAQALFNAREVLRLKLICWSWYLSLTTASESKIKGLQTMPAIFRPFYVHEGLSQPQVSWLSCTFLSCQFRIR